MPGPRLAAVLPGALVLGWLSLPLTAQALEPVVSLQEAVTARGSAAGGDEEVRVGLGQMVGLPQHGATASYAVASDIVLASLRDGEVLLHGLRAGSTVVSLVMPDGVRSFRVAVTPRPPRVFARPRRAAEGATGWEGRYQSQSARLTNRVEVVSRDDDWSLRLDVLNSTRLDSQGQGEARSSFPFATAALGFWGHELVLLDELVSRSALTVDGTALRGAHYRGGGLELHAGVTSPFVYRDVLIPTDPEAAVGASYRWTFGKSALTPNVYYFHGVPQYGGKTGAVGSLQYEYGAPGDRLRLTGELGYGGKPGAALWVEYGGASNRVAVRGRHLPRGFSSLGMGRPHGSFLDATWSSQLTSRLSLNLAGAGSRYELPGFQQESLHANGELRWDLGRGFGARSGATWGMFESSTSETRIRSLTVPVGLSWDSSRFGLAGLYRYQMNTATNQGGSGGRVSARFTGAGLYANAFVDYQRDAATVELLFRDDPALGQAFAELGLNAGTPEEVERLLQEHPELVGLGYLRGTSVELHPWRLQGGAGLTWRASDPSRQQLRIQVLFDRTRTASRLRHSALATLEYSRRVAGPLELFAELGAWVRELGRPGAQSGWSWGLGARMRFDELPGLAAAFRGDHIGGRVFGDDEGAGADSGAMPPVAGARVRLDGQREQVTDGEGRFRFDGAGPGAHRVELVMPAEGGVWFTTPSAVEVQAGGEVSFGLARAPSRLRGEVGDDAGAGLAGVTVRLSGGGREFAASTDSGGGFSFAVPPGEYSVSVVHGSVPPGYDLAALEPRAVELKRGEPARSGWVIAAARSISGTVRAPWPAGGTVRIASLDRSAPIGHGGRFVFRGLPPGRHVLAIEAGARLVRREVEVPGGPAMIRGIELDACPGRGGCAAPRAGPTGPAAVTGEGPASHGPATGPPAVRAGAVPALMGEGPASLGPATGPAAVRARAVPALTGEEMASLGREFSSELSRADLFAPGRAELSAGALELLNRVAGRLRSHPEVRRVRLEVHTDASGARAESLALSLARANRLRDHWIRRGLEPSRVEALGFGPDRPIAPNVFRAGREANQRVELVLGGKPGPSTRTAPDGRAHR